MSKKGSIIIPLVVILGMSIGVLTLAKFFNSSQADVMTAIDSRYDNSTSLSSRLDPVGNWVFDSDPTHKYKLYYPKQWVGNKSSGKSTDYPQTYERFLSTKINLKIVVTKTFDVPLDPRFTKFGNNTFDFYKDEEDIKSAFTRKNNLYYNVELKQNAYFATAAEFRGLFFQILKKFEFLK